MDCSFTVADSKSFWVPRKYFRLLKKTNIQEYLRNIFLRIMKIMLCVLIRIALMSALNIPLFYEYTQHTIIL